jgi:hypothetical protein
MTVAPAASILSNGDYQNMLKEMGGFLLNILQFVFTEIVIIF